MCALACACRPPSYVEQRFLEPQPLARQHVGVWLDAPLPQVGSGLNGLLPNENGPFPYHPREAGRL